MVTLYKTADDMKANKEMDHVKGFQVQLDDNTLDFDLKKDQETAAKGQGLTPEQLKAMQEAQAKQAKETNTVKSLNEKLNAAKTAADAGDFDTAIAALTEATQMDATRDLIWFKLGDYYRIVGAQTDRSDRKTEAVGFSRRGLSEGRGPEKGYDQRQGSQRNQEPGRLLQQPGGCSITRRRRSMTP